LLNGFTIRYLGLSPILSPGQLIRGLLIILLLFDLFNKNKITKENKYIYMSIPFFISALLLYIIRDGELYQIPLEIISFTKPLFFLVLFHFVYTNRFYFASNLDKIMIINLFVYSSSIIISSITGIGIPTYTEFYTATKSFFYGNNVTSVTGLILCIYYSYKLSDRKINLFYYFVAFTALFLSGGKIILIVPPITIIIVLIKIKNKIKKTIYSFCLFFVFIIGVFNSPIFINNSFTQRYYTRAFREAFSYYDRESINIAPLRLYSYASVGRAFSANTGLNNIFNEPENLFFGYGISMRSTKVGYYYGKMGGAEMDIIDMFLDYGIIGFLLIYIPIFKIIIPKVIQKDFSQKTMVVYLLFIYSSLAGHVLTTPMAGSLFALFLGVCGSEIKSNPSKPVFV